MIRVFEPFIEYKVLSILSAFSVRCHYTRTLEFLNTRILENKTLSIYLFLLFCHSNAGWGGRSWLFYRNLPALLKNLVHQSEVRLIAPCFVWWTKVKFFRASRDRKKWVKESCSLSLLLLSWSCSAMRLTKGISQSVLSFLNIFRYSQHALQVNAPTLFSGE